MVTENGGRKTSIPEVLPVLPLADTVLYPGVGAPVLIGHAQSMELVTAALGASPLAVAVAQKADAPGPHPDDLYRVGTASFVHELARTDAAMHLVVHGIARVRTLEFVQTEPYLMARIERAPEPREAGVEVDALMRKARELFAELVRLAAEPVSEVVSAVDKTSDGRQLAYLLAAAVPLPLVVRQEVLEVDSVVTALRTLVNGIQHEIAVRLVMQRITSETAVEMSKAQREHVLRQHMQSIQKALVELGSGGVDTRQLREQVDGLPLPEEAQKEAARELDRLDRTPEASPEHGIIQTYLEWIAKLPWGKVTGERIDVEHARSILDADHYDLEKVKERILDYLAVKRLRDERTVELDGDGPHPDARTEPILCLLGPPGVGKTSLAQSIARALGRTFARRSLGGIHDEAEIRGHRRTYIGAMPGAIMQALARAGTADPIFLLDEIDKLGVGFQGDPSAALLELLDPNENHTFVDTYLGVPFDLSRVFFICAANTTETIPAPLLDRMETLTIAGYTEQEKVEIARRFLVPNQQRTSGLRRGEVVVPDATLLAIIRRYTREAGVRSLEREVGTVLRKAARRVAELAPTPIIVEPDRLAEYLGPRRHFDEVAEHIDRPGVAAGLAWTPSGGDVLFVEASMLPGTEERLILTGMLGNVMRESAEAALTYLRGNAEKLGIDVEELAKRKVVHVHVPAGGIPKDGPSAGVTLLVALASQALGRPVRGDLAMTGEITLRGKVLPVGGIKEKVLSAHRAGLRTVILPRNNEGDLEDIPEEVRRAMRFVFAESVDEVLREALALEDRGARARVSEPPRLSLHGAS